MFLKLKKKSLKSIEEALLISIKSALESSSVFIDKKYTISKVEYSPEAFIFSIYIKSSFKEKTYPPQRNGLSRQIQKVFELNGISVPYFLIWE